jgi:CubicO group peptidase (beta-lactamase class C family)
MKKLLLLLLILPCLAVAQDIAKNAYEYLTAMTKQQLFSGTVLIAKGGTVVFEKAYGYADDETKRLNTLETEFRIGSVSKQFTAAIILRLAEQGKLSVSDRVSKFIPDYPNGDKITIHHLLSHQSGIPNFTASPEFGKWQGEQKGEIKLITIISRFKDLPLRFSSGQQFEYSNSNYSLLSYVAEIVSEQKFADLLQASILRKSNMSRSGLDTDNRSSKDKALGYMTFNDGKPVPAAYNNMSIPSGAGAMYSTVSDLYKWDRALKTELLLSAKSKEKAFTPNKDNYGYGWVISTKFGHKEYTHGGAIDGFLSSISRYPDDDACIIVLSNNMQTPVSDIANTLSAIAFGEKFTLPVERKTVVVPQAILDQYAGEYELNPQFIIKVTTTDGKLLAQATNQPVFELFPSSDKDFFLKVVPADVTFNKDANGKVFEMELHQNGTAKLKKIK